METMQSVLNASVRRNDSGSDLGMMLSRRISRVFERISPVRGRALLFGSRARGDARPDSDWDVLILLDKDSITPSDMDEVGYPLREFGWEADMMINPIMYTEKDWQKRHMTPFYANVMKEGIPL